MHGVVSDEWQNLYSYRNGLFWTNKTMEFFLETVLHGKPGVLVDLVSWQ